MSGGLLPISSPSGLGAGALPPLPSHLGSELGGWAEAAARAAHLPAVSWQRLCPRGRRGKGEERRYHDRRGDGRRLLRVLRAGAPTLPVVCPSCFHPRAPGAGWGLSSSSGLPVPVSLGVLSNADDLASCAGGLPGSVLGEMGPWHVQSSPLPTRQVRDGAWG